MTDQEIKDLRELCEKASSKPWTARLLSSQTYIVGPVNSIGRPTICDFPRHPDGVLGRDIAEANALFVEAARVALPRLLDEVEELRKALERHGIHHYGCQSLKNAYGDRFVAVSSTDSAYNCGLAAALRSTGE